MINIISTDSIYEGQASAVGIRSFQLYNLFTSLYNFKKIFLYLPNMNFKKNIKKNIKPYSKQNKKVFNQDLNILSLNAFNLVNFYKNIIIDGFSPITIEEEYLNLSEIEMRLRRLQIKQLLLKCKGIIYATFQQKYYYLGLLNTYKINSRKLFYIPLYLPLYKKKRFKFFQNKILLSYGGIYPWTDINRMLRFFSRLPNDWRFLFKGVKHPRFERDQGLKILEKTLNKFPRLKKRCIINTNWDNKIIKVNLGIFLGKGYEKEISCRTRALDMMSQEIPVILDEEEFAFKIGKDNNLAFSYKENIDSILNRINKYTKSFYNFSFEEVKKIVKSQFDLKRIYKYLKL